LATIVNTRKQRKITINKRAHSNHNDPQEVAIFMRFQRPNNCEPHDPFLLIKKNKDNQGR
jgi:hypothetical protein